MKQLMSWRWYYAHEGEVITSLCDTCGSMVLEVFDCGQLHWMHPRPLDQREEILTLLAGLDTFEIHWPNLIRKAYAEVRTLYNIRADALRGERSIVLAQHECSRRPNQKPIEQGSR